MCNCYKEDLRKTSSLEFCIYFLNFLRKDTIQYVYNFAVEKFLVNSNDIMLISCDFEKNIV